jgi:hypothetical protein
MYSVPYKIFGNIIITFMIALLFSLSICQCSSSSLNSDTSLINTGSDKSNNDKNKDISTSEYDQIECSKNETVGEGQENTVYICSGEDWWLPDSVNVSEYGHVMSFNPSDCWQNENVSMIKSVFSWKGLAGIDSNEDGIVSDTEKETINSSFGKTLKRYSLSWDKPYEKELYISVFSGSDEGVGPEYIADLGVPMLVDFLNDWASMQDDPIEAQEKADNLWTKIKVYHRNDSTLYTFWDSKFLAERETYISSLGSYIDSVTTDSGIEIDGIAKQLNFNSENCFINSYFTNEILSVSQIDSYVEKLFDTGQFDSTPPISADKWLVNLCTGGRAYLAYANAAKNYGMGIGTHGSSLAMPLLYQTMMDNTYYDVDLKAYRPTGRNPYAFIHADETHFGQNANTYGNYRMHRHLVLASLGLGVNRLMIDGFALPSEGKYISDFVCNNEDDAPQWLKLYDSNGELEDGCFVGNHDVDCDYENEQYECTDDNSEYYCDFDWNEIKNEGAPEFIKWVNQVIGVPAQVATEAYINLAQTGTDLPTDVSKKDFKSNLDSCFTYDDWGTLKNREDCKWDYHLKYPVLSYFGNYVDLDQTINGGKGIPALLLNKDSLGGKTVPAFNATKFGGELQKDELGNILYDEEGDIIRESNFYEGKRTDHPKNTSSENNHLYFKLLDSFVRPETSIVEVPEQTFNDTKLSVYGSIKENDGNFDHEISNASELTDAYVIKVFYKKLNASHFGTWRLEYDGKAGWTIGPEVSIAESDDKEYMTATFHITDAHFANGGEEGADFTIHTLSGYSPGFTHIRIIKLKK